MDRITVTLDLRFDAPRISVRVDGAYLGGFATVEGAASHARAYMRMDPRPTPTLDEVRAAIKSQMG